MAKILLSMRLTGRALNWLHAKAEFVTLPFVFTSILIYLINRQSKIAARQKFQNRMWHVGETFHEYVHEKIILANLVPVDNDELIDYVIEGIPFQGRDVA